MRETERERDRERVQVRRGAKVEGEVDSLLSRVPNVGWDPRAPGHGMRQRQTLN